MNKRKWLKYGLIILFILVTGIFYSCTASKKQDIKIELQSQEVSEISTDDNHNNSNFQTKTQSNSIENNNVSENSIEEKQDGNETVVEDYNNNTLKEASGVSNQETETLQNSQNSSEETKTIYIHICGEVKDPDVYEVKDSARLIDVIKLAGGLTKDAAGDFVNQASKLTDGQQIYIPSKEETKDKSPTTYTGSVNNEPVNNGEGKGIQSDNINSDTNNASNMVKGKVNINTASKEELMTLTGIGEAKADSILAYRDEQGNFQTIDEIKNIKGIKDSVFNKISEEITVN